MGGLWALLDLLESVRHFVDDICHVQVRDWLFVDGLFDGDGSKIDWRIADAGREQSIQEAKRQDEWITTHVDERYGFRIDDLLSAFRAAGGSYGKTRELLRESCTTGVVLSPQAIRKLIQTLYTEYPELWSRFCGDLVPSGCSPRPVGNVIPIRGPKGPPDRSHSS